MKLISFKPLPASDVGAMPYGAWAGSLGEGGWITMDEANKMVDAEFAKKNLFGKPLYQSRDQAEWKVAEHIRDKKLGIKGNPPPGYVVTVRPPNPGQKNPYAFAVVPPSVKAGLSISGDALSSNRPPDPPALAVASALALPTIAILALVAAASSVKRAPG